MSQSLQFRSRSHDAFRRMIPPVVIEELALGKFTFTSVLSSWMEYAHARALSPPANLRMIESPKSNDEILRQIVGQVA